MSQRVTRSFGLFAMGSGLFLVWMMGCSAIKVTEGPGGRHVIACEQGMKDCIGRAARLCGDDGYTIVRGVSRPTLLGGSASPNRTMAEVAELVIVCGEVDIPEGEECAPREAPPQRDEEPAQDAQQEDDPNGRVCVPGATQKCVGPGACEGGQRCEPDGKGFGQCDCGREVIVDRPPSSRDGEGAPPKRPSSLEPGKPAPPPSVPAPGSMPSPTPLRP